MKQSLEKSNRRNGQSPSGFALVTVLLLVSLLAVISITLHRTGMIHATLTYHQEDGEAAYYTAMAGVQHALFVLTQDKSYTGPLDTSGPNEIVFGYGSYAATIIHRKDVPIPSGNDPIAPMGNFLISSTGKAGSTVRTIEKWVCPAMSPPREIIRVPANDTYLREEEPGRRYGDSSELRIGSVGNQGLRALFDVNLQNISNNATIISATIELYMYGNLRQAASSNHLEISLHRLTQDWKEGNENGEADGRGACWNWHVDQDDWTDPGADFDPTVVSTTNILYGDTDRWYEWDVTTLVQCWVDGCASNDGFVLKDVDEGNPIQADSMEALFYSSEYGDSNYRPKVTVVYRNE